HLEDQQLPKRCGHLSGKTLIEPDEMAAKIRAAVEAKRDRDFFLIARTDARGVDGFNGAVARAHPYKQTGGERILSEALESAEEFARFAKEAPGPLLANMTEFGKSPLLTAKQLADFGYRLILFPVTTLRVALFAAEVVLKEVKAQGSQQASLAQMM